MKRTNANKCAERKAQRLAGKTRGRPHYEIIEGMPKAQWLEQRPTLRYRPAMDGTRRGIPNGLPDSWILQAAVRDRREARVVRSIEYAEMEKKRIAEYAARAVGLKSALPQK